MTAQKLRDNRPTLIILAIFVIWSAVFIYQISFIAVDGKWYVNLFDDAMISMRYAWNLAHGLGLVWNPGEYVEGYTNLLMTLLMSVVIFIVDDKRLAVLLVNISGIFIMMGIAVVTARIAGHLSRGEPESQRKKLRILTLVCVLFYYPLLYWSLMGMETGLVTLFILLGLQAALQFVSRPNKRVLFFGSFFLGLAYLTRPDAFIAAGLIFLFLIYEIFRLNLVRRYLWPLLSAGGTYALFIAGQQIFRWNYYGEWVPNTYVLKATGMPLLFRISDGVTYLIPFLQSTMIALVLMIVSLLVKPQRQKLLLMAITIAYLGYQIWVGGDAFPPYWRIIAPVMPLVLAMCIQGVIYLAENLLNTNVFRRSPSLSSAGSRARFAGLVVSLVTATIFLSVNAFFVREILFLIKPHEAEKNEYHVNTAIALNHLTTAEATVGVSSAGIVPFYTDDRVAVDFLGKSDKHIANLPPDLTGGARYGDIFSLPGHNKYDLDYSIKTLQPTYIQITGWGGQNITAWVKAHYAIIDYKGVQLYLRKDSEAVLWEKIEALQQQHSEDLKVSDP